MLVLTRKQQEKIRIGDDIVVTVLRMKGKSVRLGIEAPGNVSVLRGELIFDVAEDEGQPTDENETGSADERSDSPPQIHRIDARQTDWRTDSNPFNSDSDEHGQPEVDVGHYRVPREDRADVLPELVRGNGPLRAMLDRRAVAP